MNDSLRKGWALIVHSVRVFQAYPTFLLPILAVWSVYAPGVLYLKYIYLWKAHTTPENLGVMFLFIFALSFLILMSCAVVLEMIRQIESGQPSLSSAIGEAFAKDALRVLPLAIVWAIIWFLLTVIEALLSKARKGDDDNDALTAQNAAETIANYRDFSLSAAFIDALKKGVRMVMFLIMPAIAWENLGFFDAVKKGLAVLRAHLGDFASGYALTYAASAILLLPPMIIFELGRGHHGQEPMVHFPDYAWVCVIIYVGFVWSFFIYLEQMFMAQLYLWHLKWEEKMEEAKRNRQPLPEFRDVDRPELLERTPGLFA